jgi:hypothetical protein
MMSDRLFVEMMGDRLFVGMIGERSHICWMMRERSLQGLLGLLSTFLLHYKGYRFSVGVLIMGLTKFAVGVCRG